MQFLFSFKEPKQTHYRDINWVFISFLLNGSSKSQSLNEVAKQFL